MEQTIKEQLMERADGEYRAFSASLIPNIDVDHMLGVRLPELRKLARKVAIGDWRTYLGQADSDYFEEIMLQGMVIGYVKTEVEDILRHVADFTPKINNWSVCDSFCAGLKFTEANKERVWEFLQPYLSSEREYDLRFGIVMLLFYYIEDMYISRVLQRLDRIRHEGYYVKMAVAWALSISYVKMPEPTLVYLTNNRLDDFTYNKALQKITESSRVDSETKKRIRGMKRNA